MANAKACAAYALKVRGEFHQQRAQAAAEYLERQGVSASRLCVTSVEPRETRGEFQSVTFVVGQLPF